MSDKLPTPATAQDMYAYAMVTELRRLNSSLDRLVSILDEVTAVPDDIIELKEPSLTDAIQDADAPLTVETVEQVPAKKKPAHRDEAKASE